jgi:hypothetical protein
MRSFLTICFLGLFQFTAAAAFMNTPPDGDDPTPEGWLLIKMSSPGNAVRILNESQQIVPMFTPGVSFLNILTNYNGMQFWVDTEDTLVDLVFVDMEGFHEPAVTWDHDFSLEVLEGLDQIQLTAGAYGLDPEVPQTGSRGFDIEGASLSYLRFYSTYATGGTTVVAEPPAWLLLGFVAAVGLAAAGAGTAHRV